MAALCDVNFLVALCHRSHQHHHIAKNWLSAGGGDAGLVLCRITQLGLLRLLTNPAVMRTEVISCEEAWGVFETMMSDGRFSMLIEPDGLNDKLREYTRVGNFSHKLWQDAYLAAFAVSADLRLVTFDQDFNKFPSLDAEILVTGS
jgi:toxin-antitoxin system PIN domain toxin